jgi:heptosyltransferase-2
MPRPLIIRLRNWVGDVVLGLPTLQRLQRAGYALQLLGKPWAAELLAGHGWSVETWPRAFGERQRLLRRLKREAAAVDTGFNRRLNAIAFPFSFGCALDLRLAGLKAIGHAHEARSWLLAHALPRAGAGPNRPHELAVYWQIGSALLGEEAPLPERIALRSAPRHEAAANALLAMHGIAPGFIVICPFAGGTFEGRDKTWPAFAGAARGRLRELGRELLVLPGPGEEAEARERFGSCRVLTGVGLGAYAALLRRAALMISNDTGPGHLAAAVDTPLVSVLGPSDPAQWRAWGPSVHLVRGQPGSVDGWPSIEAVVAQAEAQLRIRGR